MVDPATLKAPGFPRIADYALLSDCHSGALVAPDGTVEWLCVPRFDSPSVFGAMLDRGAGRFRLGPRETVPVARRYVPGTNVLETTWATRTGWLVVHDALTIGPWRERPDDPHTRPPPDLDAERVLVRVAECLQGEVELSLLCHPAPDYGRQAVTWSLADDRRSAMAETQDGDAAQALLLSTDLNLGIEHQRAEARHRLAEGERCFCALSWGADPEPPASADEALARVDATSEYWRRWLEAGSFADHPWRIHLQRSALTLKGLSYSPTRRDGRRAHHLAPRDARRRAQLGLPLLLDPRRDLHPLEPARARARRRGRGLRPLHRRHLLHATATSCRSCTGSAASAS